MPIPIVKEPKSYAVWGMERCCFCRTDTGMWTDLKDRTPGQQVACCARCAGRRMPQEVPSKDEWFRSERALTRAKSEGVR